MRRSIVIAMGAKNAWMLRVYSEASYKSDLSIGPRGRVFV